MLSSTGEPPSHTPPPTHTPASSIIRRVILTLIKLYLNSFLNQNLLVGNVTASDSVSTCVFRLGTPVATPGFHTSTCMYPTETLVSWRDVKRTCTIFFCITSYSAPVATPTAAAAGCASTSAAAAVETYEVPLFTITAVCGNVNPPQTGTVSEALRSFGSEAVEVSRSFQSPEEACTKLFALHELAEALYAPNGPCDAQSAAVIEAADAAVAAQAAGESMEGMTEFYLLLLRGDEKLLRTLQQLPMVPMRCPCLLFGLSEIPVMMLLEGHEAVEHCLHYKYAQVCTSINSSYRKLWLISSMLSQQI